MIGQPPLATLLCLTCGEIRSGSIPSLGRRSALAPTIPLGSHWIGFALAEGQYKVGIHGTYAENLVGQAVSHGCVRMRNADIQYLFSRLSIGTPITVLPS
jgi:lipoprotein-anchoring transpeptidase ErfK/SrfK